MGESTGKPAAVDMQAIANAVISGNRELVVELVKKAIETGVPPGDILEKGLIAGMEVVGRKFKANEFYVPEVLIAARAMSNVKEKDTKPGAMEILEPHLARAGVQPVASAIIGTVKGDLHDIGKNLVVMMMEGGGYEVVDLGADVSAERFVDAVRNHRPAFVGFSALLTTTMKEMRQTILALEKAGLRSAARVIVGGAPVTERFAREIGADGYAPDATSVVAMMQSLL